MDPFKIWRESLLKNIYSFLEKVQSNIVAPFSLPITSLLISTTENETSELKETLELLKSCFLKIGIPTNISCVSSLENFKEELKNNQNVILVCTQSYLRKIEEIPGLREEINEWGKTGTLLPLLCSGGFGDVALKIVDGHYLIRAFHSGVVCSETPTLSGLQSLLDIFFNYSGSQGLGIVVDILDLEKKEFGKAYIEYKKLFEELVEEESSLTRKYQLKVHLFKENEKNVAKNFELKSETLKTLENSLGEFLEENNKIQKTFLLFCHSLEERLVVDSVIEKFFIPNNDKVILTIDCQYFPGKTSFSCIKKTLEQLKFKLKDIEELKQSPLVIFFKGYEQIGTFCNLFVKNQLFKWPLVKVIVSCKRSYFHSRDYSNSFIEDPSNPQPESLKTLFVPSFFDQSLKSLLGESGDLRNQNSSEELVELEGETRGHLKYEAQRSVLRKFLARIRGELVSRYLLKEDPKENQQVFISYAWEANSPIDVRLVQSNDFSSYLNQVNSGQEVILTNDGRVFFKKETTQQVVKSQLSLEEIGFDDSLFIGSVLQSTNDETQKSLNKLLALIKQKEGLTQNKTKLSSQQGHLLKIVEDFSYLGIPVWLDIERMTGDIDQQMSGNIENSSTVIVIGTPRYTERAFQNTNVKKEYDAIVAKEKTGKLKVIPLKFLDDSSSHHALAPAFEGHKNLIDFRGISELNTYIDRMISLESPKGIIPRAFDSFFEDILIQNMYREEVEKLQKDLSRVPVIQMILEKNQDLTQTYDIDHRLESYISAFGLKRVDESLEKRFNLGEEFNSFLDRPNSKTFVCLGKSGSGKSLFTISCFKNLLQNWQHLVVDKENHQIDLGTFWLPIYLNLKDYSKDEPERAIDHSLRTVYELDQEDIDRLQKGYEGGKLRCLFILDGFDELGKGKFPNYPRLFSSWESSKFLVSSRPEHFSSEEQMTDAFEITSGQENTVEINYMSPFSELEIKEYVKHFETKSQTTSEDGDLFSKMETIPGLMDLLENPFLLNLVLQALPSLLSQNRSTSTPVKRSDIYDAFMRTSFNKEVYKLTEFLQIELEPSELENYCQNLSFKTWIESGTNSISQQFSNLWTFFNDPSTSHIRESVPLVKSGNNYSFTHKSLFEYFLASKFWRSLVDRGQKEERNQCWNEKLFTQDSAVISFFIDFYYSNRGKSSLEQNVLEEKFGYASQIKESLIEMVKLSQSQPNFSILSANAITLLNHFNVIMWGCDFQKVNISGADLSCCFLDFINFDEADLTNVDLSGSSLNKASFQNANMDSVKLGELPSIPESGHLAFSTDKTLFVVSHTFLKVYHCSNFKEPLKSIPSGHSSHSTSIKFIPNTHILVSAGGSDNNVKMIDVDDGKTLHEFKGTGYVSCVDCSTTHIASGSGNDILVWNIQDKSLHKTIKGHSSGVSSLCFHPNGKYLVSSGQDAKVAVWDIETGHSRRELYEHQDWVGSVSFNSSGTQFASCSGDGTAVIYDFESSSAVKHIGGGHSDYLSQVLFSPTNDDLVAISSADYKISLWSLESGKRIRMLEGHTEAVNSILFQPDGNVLFSNSSDSTVRMWKISKFSSSGSRSVGHTDEVSWITVNNELGQIVSASLDNTIRFWSMATGDLQKTLTNTIKSGFLCVEISPNGQLMAAGSFSTVVNVWKIHPSPTLVFSLNGHNGGINGLCFTKNGSLITGSGDSTINLWNTETGQLIKKIGNHQYIVNSVALNPNETRLISGGKDFCAKIWNLDSLENIHLDHKGEVREVGFDPTGELCITGCEDGQVRFFETSSGKQVFSLNYSPNSVSCFDLRPGASNTFWLAVATLGYMSHESLKIFVTAFHQGKEVPNSTSSIQLHSSCKKLKWILDPKNSNQSYITSAHQDGSCCLWKLDGFDDYKIPLHTSMMWGTQKPKKLSANNAKIKDVKGLSSDSLSLLLQRGALDN